MTCYCIPATSASVERLFSHAGITVSPLRSCLSSRSIEELIWLRLNWDDSLLQVDYRVPASTADEEKQEQEAPSEDDADYIDEAEGEDDSDSDAENGQEEAVDDAMDMTSDPEDGIVCL
jgi:hAT family C-terminal dimerisation region